MVREETGDLIRDSKRFDVIAHGVNCFCKMRSGIAKQVVQFFPEAQQIDLSTIEGDRGKMGTINFTSNTNPIVVNAYTQYMYGTDNMKCDYDALRNCMKAIKTTFSGKKIGLPQIGAGLAGGDWNIIKQIIIDELSDEDVTIVYWEK
ncbi:MAG: putative phosphatase [Bacteroidota bacterium]|nr:putative phosphatase [Bacteroidota bacterium]